MRMVIEIPEELYDMILSSDKTIWAEFVSKEAMMYAIKNSTPLDDIRQEIENLEYSWYEVPYENVIDDVIGIIDKCISGKDGES